MRHLGIERAHLVGHSSGGKHRPSAGPGCPSDGAVPRANGGGPFRRDARPFFARHPFKAPWLLDCPNDVLPEGTRPGIVVDNHAQKTRRSRMV